MPTRVASAWLLVLASLPMAGVHAQRAASVATDPRIERLVERRGQQVRELEQAVQTQEARSREASERLRQRDQAILRLQHQLQALDTAAMPSANASSDSTRK